MNQMEVAALVAQVRERSSAHADAVDRLFQRVAGGQQFVQPEDDIEEDVLLSFWEAGLVRRPSLS